MKTIFVLMLQPTAPAYVCFIKEEEAHEKIEQKNVKIYDIPDLILSWSEKYDTYNVRLIGDIPFTQNMVKQVQAKEIVKYNESKINFKLGRIGD